MLGTGRWEEKREDGEGRENWENFFEKKFPRPFQKTMP